MGLSGRDSSEAGQQRGATAPNVSRTIEDEAAKHVMRPSPAFPYPVFSRETLALPLARIDSYFDIMA